MARSYVLEIGGDGGGTPVNPIPGARAKMRVSWVMEGNVSDVVGFNVCLTHPSGSPLNSDSVKHFVFVQNPAARDFTFENVVPGEWVSWVQSVVPGGDSKWMASTTLTVADDGQPSVRGSDDRNIQAYVEDFRSASLPTGFTITDGDYSLVAESGKIRLSPNHATNQIQLAWDVEAWIDAYLDASAKRSGKAVVIMRLKLESALLAPITPQVTVKNSAGGTTTLGVDKWGSVPKTDGFLALGALIPIIRAAQMASDGVRKAYGVPDVSKIELETTPSSAAAHAAAIRRRRMERLQRAAETGNPAPSVN